MKKERLFWLLLFPGILLGIAVLLRLHGPGHTHPEANVFLLYYNSGRPLLPMIFDPLRTDWNLYQARELSYLFDFLDARFIRYCIGAGVPHFLSLSTLAMLALTLLAQQIGIAAAFPELRRREAVLPSLLYLFSQPVAELSFFRSAKPGAAFALTVIAFAAAALWRRPAGWRFRPAAWSALAAALVLAPFFDRQGAYAVGAFAGANALLAVLLADRRIAEKMPWHTPETAKTLVRMAAAGCAAWGLATLYDLVIAPEVIQSLNGYRPSFAYQHVGIGGAVNVFGGIFLLDNFGHLLCRAYGSISVIAGAAAVILAALLWRSALKKRSPWHPVPWVTLAVLLGMLLCFNLMTSRHPAIVRDDIVHGIYFLPGMAVTVCLLALNLAAFDGVRHKVVLAVLLFALCAGLAAPWLPRPEFEDHLRFHKESSPRVLELLAHPELDPKREVIPYSSLILIETFGKR